MAAKIEFENPNDIIERYAAGTSLKKLADELGHSRTAVFRLLTQSGVPIRGQPDAERLKWQGADRSAIERQCAKAWAASRGRRVSQKTLTQTAISLFRNQSRNAGANSELPLVSALIGAGIDVDWQFPEGTYNLDIAIRSCRVAVEVQVSKHRHRTSSIRAERLEYILDRGWCVLAVYIPQKRTMNVLNVAQKVVALTELARRDPTAIGKYGMVGCNGEPVTPPRFNFPDRPRIEGF